MSGPMGTARVRTMTVEQVHAWARGIPGLPRGDADGFAGQCFLEDIDGTALLAQTRDTLCNELGVAQHHVGAVEAAIASLLSHEGAVGANVTAATPRSVHDTFHELMVSEGVPPYSPGAAARVSAAHPPASTPSFLLQVERSLSALQDRYGSVVALEKSLSHEAFESAQKQRAVSVAAAEAVRLDLEEQLTGHSEVCRALEHRAAAAEREVWEARHLSDALMTTVESRHITREAELVARVEELMARIAEQTQARVTAERRRDEMESELELAQAIGEAAQEELATELGRSREEKAATKIQMIWRLHRVTKAALTDPLSRRALLLEVESARVAAAAKNMQIKTLELHKRLALQEKQLASAARMREAMQQYAQQRLALKTKALSRSASSAAALGDDQVSWDLVSSEQREQAGAMAKRTLSNSPTAAAGHVVASYPVTPVSDYEESQSKERSDMQVQEVRRQAQQVQPRRQRVVALDEV